MVLDETPKDIWIAAEGGLGRAADPRRQVRRDRLGLGHGEGLGLARLAWP
jgi:hypothetical protein